MSKIRFGVNYIPSKNWLHNWINWDAASVEDDLIALKSIGVDHIRANLLWPYFQLDPNIMCPAAMDSLKSFVSICEKTDMDFFLGLFTGYMSGTYFLPHWHHTITKEFGKGVFDNPQMIEAEEFYIRQIAPLVADSPSFMGFDLGNELSCILCRNREVGNDKTDAWQKKMIELCEELAPGKLHNNGVDHMPWFTDEFFSRDALANEGGITPVHTYARFTGALERFGRQATESIHLAPFMIEMARAFCRDTDRKYWVQEFGSVTVDFDDEVEEFISKSFEAMTTSENLWGITWWCSHNIPMDYKAYHDIEYNLGLFDPDNKLTRAGELFKKTVEKYSSSFDNPPARKTAIVMERYDEAGKINADFIWSYGKKYAELVDRGIYPAFVLAERAGDTEYLKSRGIEEIIYPENM